MKIKFNAFVCAIALGFSAGAFAQATSNVNAQGKIEQFQQGGDEGVQELYIGTVKSGGGNRTSNVTITSTGSIYQRQIDTDDTLQVMKIGHVEADGSSNVTVLGRIEQQQFANDDDASQDMKIGVVEGRGTTQVTVRNITQWQSSDASHQRMNVGSILK